MKPQPDLPPEFSGSIGFSADTPDGFYEMRGRHREHGPLTWQRKLPWWRGDLLWVREAWRTDASFDHLSPKRIERACLDAGYKRGWAPIAYEAGGYSSSWGNNGWYELGARLRPSVHMPRWASRLTLEVTGVKVERLQDISDADAEAEGITAEASGWRNYGGGPPFLSAIASFATLWDCLNGAGAWAADPWVVATSFKVHRANIDDLLRQRVPA